jgi:hypothetical protein
MGISDLAAAIFDFSSPVTSDSIYNRSSKLVTLENIGVVVGISTLCSLQAELLLVSVWRLPSWISHFRLRLTVMDIGPSNCATSKTWGGR